MEQGTGPRSFQRNRPYCTFKRGLSPQGGQLSLHHTVGHLSPQHLVILVLAGDVAEGTWISIGLALAHRICVILTSYTSGSTLGEVLRTLRILNEDNRISIFSLIGRRDLMADVTT